MEDTNATVVAESQPVEVAEPIEVEDLSDQQRTVWQKTGELPAKTKSGVPSPPKPGTAQSAEAKIAESGTAQDRKERTDQQENWRQIVADRDTAKQRADKAERELAELRTKSETPKAAPSPAAADPNEPKPPDRPIRPKLGNFETVELYEAAMDKHEEAMLEYPGKKSAFESAKAQAEKLRTDVSTFNKTVEENWKTRVDAAKEKHADFEAVAFAKDLGGFIPWGSPVDEWLLQSEQGAEMLYHLASNREELKRIAGLNRPEQHAEMLKLQNKFAGTTAKVESEPPKNKVTAAKRPPSEVGGKGVAAEDEEETALKEGNVDRYIELANKRDIAKRKAAR